MTATETGQTYDDFLRGKVDFDKAFGFPVYDDQLSPILKPHQAAIVKWACHGGRRAIFAAFGLGKGIMQLEILRLVQAREGGRQLIVCPLGVRQEWTTPREHGTRARYVFGAFGSDRKNGCRCQPCKDANCAYARFEQKRVRLNRDTGCGDFGTEVHHWAPREVFGPEADNWPTSWLCRVCHEEWHKRIKDHMAGSLF